MDKVIKEVNRTNGEITDEIILDMNGCDDET